MDKFGEWLLSEMNKRGMTQSRLAKESGLTQGSISNIISGRRGRSDKSLSQIARALKLPQEHVFTVAGILKEKKGADPDIDLIMHHVKDLDQHDRDAVLEFIRMLDRLRPKRKK
jgi:transcriptional regulator with XRE-family HTH domain